MCSNTLPGMIAPVEWEQTENVTSVLLLVPVMSSSDPAILLGISPTVYDELFKKILQFQIMQKILYLLYLMMKSLKSQIVLVHTTKSHWRERKKVLLKSLQWKTKKS